MRQTDTVLYDKDIKKGPRDIDDVSWAIGKFLFLFFSFFCYSQDFYIFTIADDNDDYTSLVENRAGHLVGGMMSSSSNEQWEDDDND